MWRPKQSVENENVDCTKCAERVFRQLFRVGDVTEVTDAVTVNRDGTVRDRHRQHIHISNTKGLARWNRVGPGFRLASPWQRFDRRVEDVRETLRQTRH